jgi:hypothetical protein
MYRRWFVAPRSSRFSANARYQSANASKSSSVMQKSSRISMGSRRPSVPAVVQKTVDVAGPEESADAATDAEDIDATEVEVSEPVSTSYESFADLYDDVAPKTGTQKAVTAGYWFEVKEGKQSWKASEVNKLLKSIDVKVSSISIVLTNAVKAKKPLIAQLERLGDSERSRKTFCLKEGGIEYVESRIA